jgi:hypothetical protein
MILNILGKSLSFTLPRLRCRSRQSMQATFTSENVGSTLAIRTHHDVKIVGQRSAESRGFSPGAPVSSHRAGCQGGLG